jgi:hypothetical protein
LPRGQHADRSTLKGEQPIEVTIHDRPRRQFVIRIHTIDLPWPFIRGG